ncbi:hypothetical protein [Mycobacterium sp.]|uniref:hypothetical protein n=1 Tax=Mycobacterium sp. TaxID=1785 RepID=UPI002BFFF9DD|nr:hypothetical protein [Mycobacterium sp.]HTY35429.1 hypothetical protein [Mycobacterium sp.]
MTTIIKNADVRTIAKGILVSRATATLPQSTTGNIFTITGGRIILRGLVGTVTTIIQVQADATKLTSSPTTGSAVDLCTTTDITGLEVGGMLALPAAVGSALVKANGGACAIADPGLVLPVGSIVLNCGASNTGSVKWDLIYTPLDNGAQVAAA